MMWLLVGLARLRLRIVLMGMIRIRLQEEQMMRLQTSDFFQLPNLLLK
jgi:hypothetical protein